MASSIYKPNPTTAFLPHYLTEDLPSPSSTFPLPSSYLPSRFARADQDRGRALRLLLRFQGSAELLGGARRASHLGVGTGRSQNGPFSICRGGINSLLCRFIVDLLFSRFEESSLFMPAAIGRAVPVYFRVPGDVAGGHFQG